MSKTSDLLGFVGTMIRDFIVPTIVRCVVYSLGGSAVFFGAGLLIYFVGIRSALAGAEEIVQVIAFAITVAVYTVLGGFVGFLLGATSAANRKLDDTRNRLNQLAEPLTARIVARIPVGKEGVPIDRFSPILDGSIVEVARSSNGQARLSSPARAVYRFVLRRILGVFRAVIVADYAEDLKRRGETTVTAQSLERFARESLTALAIGLLKARINLVRLVIAAAATGFLLISLVTALGY